jgi:hypothetical protein
MSNFHSYLREALILVESACCWDVEKACPLEVPWGYHLHAPELSSSAELSIRDRLLFISSLC